MATASRSAADDLFDAPGESAQQMRATDWSKTAFGALESWPQSLRAIVRIMLRAHLPMRVVWGPEMGFIYNDSYRSILSASQHPLTMGASFAEGFPEMWSALEPQLTRVAPGESIALEDTPVALERNGRIEERYLTLSSSPLLGDDGELRGALGIVQETTAQVVAAGRLQTLRELALRTSSSTSAQAACERAAAVLERNRTDVPFSLFYLLEGEGTLRLVGKTGLDEESAKLLAPSTVSLNAESPAARSGWPFTQAAAASAAQPADPSSAEAPSISAALVVSDLEARFGKQLFGDPRESIRTALVVPLRAIESARLLGFFIAGASAKRPFDTLYREFFERVSEQISKAASEALGRQEREELVERERQANARLWLLFNEAPAAIAVMRGPEHVFELANPLYCQLVGRSDLLFKRGKEALPELIEQGVWAAIGQVYATGAPHFAREQAIRLDRRGDGVLELGYFNSVIQATRDLDGKIEGVVVFAIDITEQVLARQSAEADRAERLRLLESQQAARTALERSNNAKDEFLSLVSHELRNPLSAMLGWTRLLRTGKLAAEKRDHALATIERSAVKQSQLIEDLLDVSRITSGKLRLELQPVDFVELVGAAIDSVRPALTARRIHFEASLGDAPISMQGDGPRLQQIVWNLLSNATKFTPEDGRVRVELKREAGAVELWVIDSGTGISQAFLPQIFVRFRPEDSSSTRKHGGLGLGLSIAKNLVELHGGTLRAESEGEGKGSTFVLRLPITKVEGQETGKVAPLGQPAALSGRPKELEGLRVLVVDDEPDARELVAEFLETCGAKVVRADSAQAALRALDAEPLDVILSDIRMPGEDGLSLIRSIRTRTREGGGKTPAASMTASAGTDLVQRALSMGFNIHLQKPVEPSELIAVVASLGKIARKS